MSSSSKNRERGKRALERQLDYQEKKAETVASSEAELIRLNFIRTQQVRQKIESLRKIQPSDRVLEVGSGAHGLIFAIGDCVGVGVDPACPSWTRW